MNLQLFLIPIIVAIFAQIIKLSIDGIRGNLTISNIFLSYGGMPSAHTALAVSLCTIVAIHEGIASSAFAVALVFMLIIMRDAITFRYTLGVQGKVLNILAKEHPQLKSKHLPHFQERIGHSLAEVLAGAAFGIIATLLISAFFPPTS